VYIPEICGFYVFGQTASYRRDTAEIFMMCMYKSLIKEEIMIIKSGTVTFLLVGAC